MDNIAMYDIESTMPSVSIIIPLYNKGPYIKRTLDSVLAQTIQSFEVVVVVDDGSTDDGGEIIVKSYRDPRIRLVRQKNRGVSSARNYGVSVARSDLIAFLDADDEWLPTHLETLLRLQQNFHEAKAYATGYIIRYNNRISKRSYCPKKGDRMLNTYYREAVKAGVNYNIISMSSFAIMKDTFREAGCFHVNLRYGEDLLLYERVAIFTNVAYSPEITSIYNNNNQSNTRHDVLSRNPVTDADLRESWKILLHSTDNQQLRKDFKKYSSMKYAGYGFGNAIIGHRMESRKMLHQISGIKYLPVIILCIVLNIVPDKIRILLAKLHYSL